MIVRVRIPSRRPVLDGGTILIKHSWRIDASEMIEGFVDSGVRSKWLELPPLSAYCRVARRLIGPTLDIASVEVAISEWRKGYFGAFLREAENIAAQHKLGLWVENALNPLVREMLERREYRKAESVPICYYKTWPDLL